jgi:hypothetical protein
MHAREKNVGHSELRIKPSQLYHKTLKKKESKIGMWTRPAGGLKHEF